MGYALHVALFLLGFVAGRFVRDLTRPRCPELRRVKVFVGWTNFEQRRMYKIVAARCELKDMHDGPCLVSKRVDVPIHWNPGEPEEYAPLPTHEP